MINVTIAGLECFSIHTFAKFPFLSDAYLNIVHRNMEDLASVSRWMKHIGASSSLGKYNNMIEGIVEYILLVGSG